MHVERVRFDRVFDVVRGNGLFSFESGGRKRYGVSLPCQVVPAEGSVLVVALAAADNWSATLGWHDPASGRIALREDTWTLFWNAAENTAWFGGIAVAAAAALAGAVGVLLALPAALFAFGCLLWRGLRRKDALRRALEAGGRVGAA
jgi:hypothetical protein